MKSLKIASIAGFVAFAALATSCAQQDTKAQQTAQQALDAANQAQACCQANTERLDRIYRRVLGK